MVSPTGAPSISLMPAMMNPTSPADSCDSDHRLGRKAAQLVDLVAAAGRHHADLLAQLHHAVDHAHQRHDADVVVEPGVDDERLQRSPPGRPWAAESA